MSFSRFGLLRSRPRLLGGLTRAGMNGMPLFHQRFSGTGGGNFSRYFDGVGTSVVTAIAGGIIGAGAKGYYDFKYHKKQQDYDESRNFQKFLTGHHVPPKSVRYEIERKEINDAIESDILTKASAPQVVNIVADKNLGKSVAVNKAVQSILKNNYREYKVFYIDASKTFQLFLNIEYNLDYASEVDAVNAWMSSMGKYAREHPSPPILVILDSPGCWEEELTDKQIKKVMRFMKDSVASDAMTFYCISSEKKNIFTKERISVFGSRFEEIKQQDWGIAFTLNVDEKEKLIKNYQTAHPSKKLTTEAKENLRLNRTNAIGLFVKEISKA